jgi:VanZ family protein
MTVRTVWRWPWLPFGFWILVIITLSSIPYLGPPDVGIPWADKICHLGEYGILGILFARAGLRNASTKRTLWVGALLGLVIGSLDENYQRHTPGRDVSALDATADTIGALLGALLWRLASARWAARRSSENRSAGK